jgi:hypothetical protein
MTLLRNAPNIRERATQNAQLAIGRRTERNDPRRCGRGLSPDLPLEGKMQAEGMLANVRIIRIETGPSMTRWQKKFSGK